MKPPPLSSCHLHQQYVCNHAQYSVPSCVSSFVSDLAFKDFAAQVKGEFASLRSILESITINSGRVMPNVDTHAYDTTPNPVMCPNSQDPEIQGIADKVDPNSSVASVESMISSSDLINLN